MAAVYDVQVRNALYMYERALVGYPISTQRRKIKVKRLRSFLQALSKSVDTYPICNSKKLGQFFDVDGNPIFPNLKQGNYEDESGTQWRMSFFRISVNKVKIYRLFQAASIDESKLKKKIFIENNNLQMNTKNMSTNKKVVRLTESDLHNIIKESVSQILNEIGETPKGAYDLGRLYGRYETNARTKSRYYPSNENEYLDKLSDMQKYIDAKKFDVARRRAFDRGSVNQRFMTDLAFDVNDKIRGYDRMIRDRDNADNLEASFNGREFMDDW